MTESPTHFAAHCIGIDPYLPPGGRFAEHPQCWLCGGPTDNRGWPLREAIPDTFTNHNRSKASRSDAVCWQCVAMSSKAPYDAYTADHPYLHLKTGYAMSWRFYSHVFWPGGHDAPNRARWRDWLLEPPEPPFMMVMAVSGQKHLIFRSKISFDRDTYFVQQEEDSILVHRREFAVCLQVFEMLYDLGFSKDSILSGRYSHAQLSKIGLSNWLPMERQMRIWREMSPGAMQLAHFCAKTQKQEEQ